MYNRIFTDLPLKPTSLYNWVMDVKNFYNEVVHLVCGVKANPAPLVRWFKRVDGNFTEIGYDSEDYILVENGQQLDVTLNEYTVGDYKCQGCNEHGCDESYLVVVSLLRESRMSLDFSAHSRFE